jgi:hypoxanthine phosphoribosyltransferase
MPTLAAITHEDFVADVLALAEQLGAERERAPDFLVGIGRGGLVPAVFLSHATGLPMLSIDHSSQVPEFAAELIATLAARTRGGERFIVVDDINDSGTTIRSLRDALAVAGAAEGGVRFAVLIDNVSSTECVDYRAREIDRRDDKRWFVFPWEAVAPTATIVEDAEAVTGRLG